MMNILKGETDRSNHDEMLFIKGKKIYGIRNSEDYKYILRSGSENSAYNMLPQGEFLFDMSIDVSEAYNKATVMPEKAKKMRGTIEQVQAQMNSNPRGWK